jgi:hypothetical protein
MYQIACPGCGEKVAVATFLTAAREKCPGCGRPLADDGTGVGDRLAREFAGERQPGPRVKRLAKQWEQRGMCAGGVVGALVVCAVGGLGGECGRPVVGAAAGALLGVLLGAIAGVARGVYWGARTGDHSWVNFWVMLEAAGGMALGTFVGLQLKQLSFFVFAAGALGGGVVGLIVGTVVGGMMGLRAEAEQKTPEPELAESAP